MRWPPLLISALLLVSCSQPEEAKASGTTSDRVAPRPVAAAIAPAPEGAREIDEENELYSFGYSYPAAAAAIPSLKAHLDADIDRRRGELSASAQEGKQGAEKGATDLYHPFSWSSDWQVVTETPRWLSLSATLSEYYGGAHPNFWFDAILWDKKAGRQRDPRDLFLSSTALKRALQPEFCRQIDEQRAEKRGEPVVRGSEDSYDQCPDPIRSTIILGSSNSKVFNRVGILVNPYVAGPYAEGDYEATIPVTPAILAAVKPEFRSSFATAP